MDKLQKALKDYPVKHLAIGGGVSANSGVRETIEKFCKEKNIQAWIPERIFTTDNAAMVAAAGYFKFLQNDFCPLDAPPYSRVTI